MKKDILDLKNKWSLTILVITLFSFVSCNQQQDIEFYKAEDVFKQFKMTKEYREDISAYKKALDLKILNFENQLDSLKHDFKLETEEKEKQTLYYKIADFQNSLDKELEKAELTLQQKIEMGDQEIWARINTYLAEFCKEKNIHLLMDVGNVVSTPYYNESHDLTEECTTYINKKYDEVLKK